MKKIILLLLCALVLMLSCTEQPYYDIPTDANGKVILTGVSSTTSTGISTLDDQFSVTATLPNAKAGDVMTVECLQLQIPTTGGTSKQLLPLSGSQKTVTVGSDLTATISFTRAEANLKKAGDYVIVTFAGKTESAKQRVDMVAATATTKPMVMIANTATTAANAIAVDVARTAETAYFNVTVYPKSGAYTGNLVAKRKNGVNDSWVDITGSPFSGTQPFLVPITGTDFAADKDTMYYSFTSTSGSYTDAITTSVIVRDPYFFLKKTAILTLGGASAGRNLLTNTAITENDAKAAIAVSGGSLILKGGSVWLAAGKTIQFVPTTLDMYSTNNSTAAITAFEAGTPLTQADPITGTGCFIYKIIAGVNPEDVYYGMIKATAIVPSTSVTIEYRIGNMYAHLLVIR